MTVVKVVQKPGADEVPTEIIAQAVVEIAAGMRQINAGRLQREAVVLLLQHATGVPKTDIRAVLAGLSELERLYIKPRAAIAK